MVACCFHKVAVHWDVGFYGENPVTAGRREGSFQVFPELRPGLRTASGWFLEITLLVAILVTCRGKKVK